MALQCVCLKPHLVADSSLFELRHEQTILPPFMREWILYLFTDLSAYVSNKTLLVKVPADNPPSSFFGIPSCTEDVTVHLLGSDSQNTKDFKHMIVCEI